MNQAIITIVIILLSFLVSRGQKLCMEEITREIEALSDTDTTKIKAFQLQSELWMEDDLSQSILLANKALNICLQLKNKRLEAISRSLLGKLYTVQEKYDVALQYFLEADKLFLMAGDEALREVNAFNTAILYDLMNETRKAIYIYKSYLEAHKGEETGYQVVALGNLGAAYFDIYEDSLSLHYNQLALQLAEKLQDEFGIVSNAVNVSRSFNRLGRFEDSYNISIKYQSMAKNIGSERISMSFLINIGRHYLNLSNSNNSVSNKKYALQAIHEVLPAYEYFKKQNVASELQMACKIISDSYLKIYNFQQAYLYLLEWSEISNTLESNKKKEKINEIELKNKEQVEQYENQLAALRNKQIKFWFWVLSLTLIGIAFWLFIIYKLRKQTEVLMQKIIPKIIARRLKRGEKPLADRFENVAVIFIDIVNFTPLSKRTDPSVLVKWLDDLFSNYDNLTVKYGLEKIKTIGDSYMAISGAPVITNENGKKTFLFAKDVLNLVNSFKDPHGDILQVRIGCDLGEVVAGVIGEYKFAYDLWGDTINTAARLESSSEPGTIHCTDRFKNSLSEAQIEKFENKGEIELKGIGLIKTWTYKF